jgi:carbon-monoxide dehydrogenase large subunit
MTDHANLRPKIVGARIKRTEDPRLLTGAGSFVDDRQVAGALALAFLRSNQAHARVVSIDTAAARAIPGVAAVFTAQDFEAQVQPLRATSRMKGYYATPIRPLAHGKVRHVGEIVAAVVAESRYIAEDALEAITVEYEPLPAATDPFEAAQPGAPLLHEEAGTNVILSREFKRGDPDGAASAAPVRVKARFRMRRKTPLAIEPRTYLAEYDRGRDALTLHSATQIPGIIRDALADALDLPGHKLRVIAPDVGGGFGGKGSLYPEEIAVCLAAGGGGGGGAGGRPPRAASAARSSGPATGWRI